MFRALANVLAFGVNFHTLCQVDVIPPHPPPVVARTHGEACKGMDDWLACRPFHHREYRLERRLRLEHPRCTSPGGPTSSSLRRFRPQPDRCGGYCILLDPARQEPEQLFAGREEKSMGDFHIGNICGGNQHMCRWCDVGVVGYQT